MSSSDFNPAEKTSTRFRLGTNRKVELTFQEELDAVAQKSLFELALKKEAKNNISPTPSEANARKLASEFVPRRPVAKRKTHPVFHDDLRQGKEMVPSKTKYSDDLPKYNSLDKDEHSLTRLKSDTKKTKKLPFSKDETTSSSAMRRPRVTPLGILPVRESERVESVQVLMEGSRITQADHDPVIGPMERANRTGILDMTDHDETRDVGLSLHEPVQSKKPAIVSQTGAIQTVAMTERPQPPSKPRSRLRPPRKEHLHSAVSVATSLGSVEIPVTGDMDAAAEDTELRSQSSNTSMKSVKELMEEAKLIATPEVDKFLWRKKREAERHIVSSAKSQPPKPGDRKKVMRESSRSSRSSVSDTKPKITMEKKSAERTVDEIIDSLKNPELQRTSDTDRQIQEIMKRVLNRTSDTFELDETEPVAVDQNQEITEDGGQQVTDNQIPDIKKDNDMVEQEAEMDDVDEPFEDENNLPTFETPAIIQEALEKLEERSASYIETYTDSGKASAGQTPDVSSRQTSAIQPAESQPPPDLSQFYKDLIAPKEVLYEDIISAETVPSQLHPRTGVTQGSTDVPPVAPTSSEFLSTWVPVSNIKPAEKSVHHFCTAQDVVQLPDQLRGIWRRYHVPSKYDLQSDFQLFPGTEEDALYGSGQPGSRTSSATERVQSAAAKRIIQQANSDSLSLEEWRARSQRVFEEDTVLQGIKLHPKSDVSFMYWSPAPPKWDLPPAEVKKTLFPEYHGTVTATEKLATPGPLQEESEDSEEDEEIIFDKVDPEDRMAKDRILERKHKSTEDLTAYRRALRELANKAAEKDEKDDKNSVSNKESVWSMSTVSSGGVANRASSAKAQPAIPTIDVEIVVEASSAPTSDLSEESQAGPSVSFADLRAKFSAAVLGRVQSPSQESHTESTHDHLFLPLTLPRKRRNSAPGALFNDGDRLEESILVYEDFNTAMSEIAKQRQKMKNILRGKVPMEAEHEAETAVDNEVSQEKVVLPQVSHTDQVEHHEDQLPPYKSAVLEKQHVEEEPTPAELALEAGRAYVLLPHQLKRKKKNRKHLKKSIARIEAIQQFLYQEPNKIKCSQSFTDLQKPVEKKLKVSKRIKEKRGSVPNILDFDTFAARKGYRKTGYEDEREFARHIWDEWFDECFPPTPSESDWEEDTMEDSREEEKIQIKRKDSSTTQIEAIDMTPIIEDEIDAMNVELIQQEIDRLNEEIDKMGDSPSAFLLARRGAMYRKLGKVKSSQGDLDRAILLEPLLLDAYWHRHLILLLQGKKQLAIEDLNFILKYNKNHSAAYRSRAWIYKEQGDVTMSIINYTQAIKLNPTDHEAYYQRAAMYEKRGEMRLAMEDYAMATKLMPSKTDALFKHGMHYFNKGNWQSAINDLTELLKQQPMDAEARMCRGRAYAKLGQWNKAAEDLSAAIHLNPRNPTSFYYRGCILRKLHPKRALQDFSVSLLLDDSEENLLSFLHRGLLYNEIGRYEDAIPDFEACLMLDKDLAVAHVNLGLIYMLKMANYQRAIKKFTQAAKSNPTYVKAYVCRAEAFIRANDIRNALLDFTRAIHLCPDVNYYYMYRGQLVLQMGNLDLAAFCVRHAAELNTGLGQSPTQQAIVQSFLKNYDKAISALGSATKLKPVAPLFSLLGKTQMKALLWKDAIASFEQALEKLKPWQADQAWPPEAAEVNFQIGLCRTEMRDYLGAHDAFNNAIRVNSKHAEAFYYRGLTRMRLKQAKGIQDFNKALALNPNLFQAYLSRAAFFGLRGQYTKAILNCNEALKLQPNSVRSYLYRGALKYHIRAYKLAILDLTQATIIENTCTLAYLNRAVCYHASGNLSKALQDYGTVLLLGDELRLQVLINRGLLYFEVKDYNNALLDFLMASRMDTRNKHIYHTIGLCHHKLQKLKQAIESFTKALTLDSHFLDAYIGRGNVFMDYGNETGTRMAKADYERALHQDPCCLAARVNLAYCLQVKNKYMMAWQQFTTAITINPRHKPALEGRAIINLQMSNMFGAYQDITASIEVAPTAELFTNRGVIHQFMNDRVNAMRDYQRALKLDVTYSLAYFNAANIYFHSRQFKQALVYYDEAIKYNSKDESALLNRAITKVMLKNSEGALQDFERAVKLSPYSAHIYFNRGNLYASLNQYAKADSDYSQALELQPDDALVLKRRADVRGKLGWRDKAIADYRRAVDIQTRPKRLITNSTDEL